MFISKKEYEELWSIINKQNNQIEELIGIAREANANSRKAQKCFFDLVELVDVRLDILPPEGKKIIDEMNNL